MSIPPELFVQIEACKHIFLVEISEPEANTLRLVIEEGIASHVDESVKVAGQVLTGGHRIEPTDESQLFELIWDNYLAYSIRNESYVTLDETESVAWGHRVALYSKSHFLDFVSRGTAAYCEQAGELQHIELRCENHIIGVASTGAPHVMRLRPI